MLAVAFVAVSAAPNVLIIGDSGGEFAQYSLAKYCKGAAVTNRAIQGTTASQWGASPSGTSCEQNDSCCSSARSYLPDDGGTCQASSAFSSVYGSGYTHVWIMIGGNDKIDSPGCGLSQSDLETRFAAVVSQVKSAGPPGIQILVTGYCQATGPYGDCSTPASATPVISAAWAAIAAQDSDVTFVDAIAACGGSATTFSPAWYHADTIHFNNRGYCSIFTMPGVQSFLGCEPSSYDCANEPITVPGAAPPRPPPEAVVAASPPAPPQAAAEPSPPPAVDAPSPATVGPSPAAVDPSPSPSAGAERREDSIDKARAKFKTRLACTLSGEVSDYDPARRLQMAVGFAATVGVSVNQVEVEVQAASVAVTFVTFSSTSESRQAVESAVESTLQDSAQLSSMLQSVNILNVNVIGAPEISAEEPGDDGNTTTIILAIVGALGGLLVLGGLLFLIIIPACRPADPIKKHTELTPSNLRSNL